MEQLSLFKEFGRRLHISDPSLKQKLEEISVPKGYKVFARNSASGLHEIGIELENQSAKRGRIPMVALPGWLHGNWSYIKLIQALANDEIEISALSPIGEKEARPFQKPIEELTMEDYLTPYQAYLKARNESVVLMGHSLGGLFAQRLKAEFREKIDGLILINSVKPSNLAKRKYSVVEKIGPVFVPMKEGGVDRLKWIHDNLFNSHVPEDFSWIAHSLSVGSNNILDDYSGEHGQVDPAKIDCPILEFVSTGDQEETAGVFNIDALDHRVDEVESLAKGRRVMISEFFANRKLSGTGNCPSYEQVIIQGGSHNSPILCEKDVEKVAQGIRENYKKMFG